MLAPALPHRRMLWLFRPSLKSSVRGVGAEVLVSSSLHSGGGKLASSRIARTTDLIAELHHLETSTATSNS